MTDLPKTLRKIAKDLGRMHGHQQWSLDQRQAINEAADQIEQQTAEIERLTREAAELRERAFDVAALHTEAMGMLTKERDEARAALAEAKGEYMDLLLCVCKRCPGESRHETAKRHLLEAERASEAFTAACARQVLDEIAQMDQDIAEGKP